MLLQPSSMVSVVGSVLCPVLLPHLTADGNSSGKTLIVKRIGEEILVESREV